VSKVAEELKVAPLQDSEVEAVISLWELAGLTRAWNDPRADIALAMRGPNSTILVGRSGNEIAATVMVGHDGHRGWFYYLCVNPAVETQGVGRAITRAGEEWLKARGIMKVMLMVRPENAKVQGFYKALGYNIEPRTIMTRWLDGRDPTP
jgi:ribosomal protein S18 acetylase RimI-like enzyme